MRKELTREELYPINAETNDRDHMEYELKRIFNRHIAKCLDHLGETIAPVQIASIKRSFRYLEEDVTTLVTQGEEHEQYNDQDGIGNR